MMPPEIWAALVVFTVSMIGLTAKLADMIATNKVTQAKNKEDQALKDREATREKDMEAVRQTTIRLQSELETAKAENEKNQAVNETLTNLVSATMTLVQTHAAESFANREAITNLAESQGTYGESVDRIATAVNENTSVTRATGTKADDVVQVVSELKALMESSNAGINIGINRIIQLLEDDEDSQELRPTG